MAKRSAKKKAAGQPQGPRGGSRVAKERQRKTAGRKAGAAKRRKAGVTKAATARKTAAAGRKAAAKNPRTPPPARARQCQRRHPVRQAVEPATRDHMITA